MENETPQTEPSISISKKHALIGSVALILTISSFFFVRAFCKPDEPKLTGGSATIPRTKVNYKSDIDFLGCIANQHACVYDHVRKDQTDFILEDCKDENYCNTGSGK